MGEGRGEGGSGGSGGGGGFVVEGGEEWEGLDRGGGVVDKDGGWAELGDVSDVISVVVVVS